MSDNTAVYMFQTSDGFRIIWGSEVEQYYTDPPRKDFLNFFRKAPFFSNLNDATVYAHELDKANRTEHGIILLSTFKYRNFKDL